MVSAVHISSQNQVPKELRTVPSDIRVITFKSLFDNAETFSLQRPLFFI